MERSIRESVSWAIVGAIAVLSVIVTPSAFSQAITGDIVGTVRDPGNAVVPGAKVVLTDMDTGARSESTCDSNGNYLFAQLKPDRYSVQVSKEGFAVSQVSDIVVGIAGRPRVDFTLKVGSTTEKVEVNAGGVPLLEPETSSLGRCSPA